MSLERLVFISLCGYQVLHLSSSPYSNSLPGGNSVPQAPFCFMLVHRLCQKEMDFHVWNEEMLLLAWLRTPSGTHWLQWPCAARWRWCECSDLLLPCLCYGLNVGVPPNFIVYRPTSLYTCSFGKITEFKSLGEETSPIFRLVG